MVTCDTEHASKLECFNNYSTGNYVRRVVQFARGIEGLCC